MATLLKVLNNLADIKSAGGVALRVRTQGRQSDAKGQGVLNLALIGRLAGPRRCTIRCGQQIICQIGGHQAECVFESLTHGS
jgi:hypothetical protein